MNNISYINNSLDKRKIKDYKLLKKINKNYNKIPIFKIIGLIGVLYLISKLY
tara:strand:- start:475 stop:630 length:156 start_codon:yes stop_codon:yes gene_type:complete